MYESSNAAGIEFKLDKETICANVNNVTQSPVIGSRAFSSDFVYGTITLLAPFWAFFALSVTHDCFRCFGKDPERNYSQF